VSLGVASPIYGGGVHKAPKKVAQVDLSAGVKFPQPSQNTQKIGMTRKNAFL
jgi:hypothetical protein